MNLQEGSECNKTRDRRQVNSSPVQGELEGGWDDCCCTSCKQPTLGRCCVKVKALALVFSGSALSKCFKAERTTPWNGNQAKENCVRSIERQARTRGVYLLPCHATLCMAATTDPRFLTLAWPELRPAGFGLIDSVQGYRPRVPRQHRLPLREQASVQELPLSLSLRYILRGFK